MKKIDEENLEKVKKLFEQNNLKINGVIFNQAEVQGNSYYSYYYSDEHYSSKKNK